MVPHVGIPHRASGDARNIWNLCAKYDLTALPGGGPSNALRWLSFLV
jgi:hypothetical protein